MDAPSPISDRRHDAYVLRLTSLSDKQHKKGNAMSAYHPIFDDPERIWNLPIEFDAVRLGKIVDGEVFYSHTKKGIIARLIRDGIHHIGTYNGGTDDYPEPLWEEVPASFWDIYIAKYIIVPPMINMDGEFDGDDIELAQIIMDEIEEGRR